MGNVTDRQGESTETNQGVAAQPSWRRQAAAATGATLDAVFRRAFRVFGGRVAVTWEDGRRTYAELGRRAWRCANALRALGIGRGDRVAILAEARVEYVETYAALAALGATAVTLNTRLLARELLHCAQKGKPSAFMVSGPLTPGLGELRDRLPSVKHWICYDSAEGLLDYDAMLAAASDDEPPLAAQPEDIHNVLFTSGTTGRPKGAMISQRAAAVRGLRLAQWFRLTEKDGFVGWIPLFHCGGDESLYATMATGGVYATLPKVDVEAMFRLIERDRLSWTLLLPGVITDFLNHPRRADYDLSSFRLAVGYSNMMPRVVQEITAACNIHFSDAFGQSESSYLLAHGISGPGELPSLAKQPTPLLEVRIVDDDMNEAPVGVPGECVVRGPTVMSGYLDDDGANAEAFAGGWLHTGDLLARQADGSLVFVDRKRYLIKTGGENVYPTEVEAVIAEHPSVQEVCVFGVADDYWGEAIKAVIVPRPGKPATVQDIVAWCRGRLSGYKRPRYVQFLRSEEMPRSTTGKLQRHELARFPVTEEQKA
ncbi:MAG: AMP-binding protein [Roseiarcus sp.]